MKRAAAFLMTALLFGCGADTAKQGTANEPPGIPVGAVMGRVGFDHLSTGLKVAKVVLKTTVTAPRRVQEYDPEMGATSDVACTIAADCAAYSGASCTGGYCVVTVTNHQIFYVSNFDSPPATGFTFPVPCDGNAYAAEVYTKDDNWMKDMMTAAKIVVDTGCLVTFPPSWQAVTKPTLSVPTIYVNLPAPYDRYTVGVNNLAYPFAANFTMTSTQGTANPVNAISCYGGGALFNSPTATDAIAFDATFGLDRSILFSDDGDWKWGVHDATQSGNPTPSAPITVP